MVFHFLALRDVVTLWVESVFILDRSEGLAVFAYKNFIIKFSSF